MWKGFKVIDADAHMHEPQHLWERYVEAEYRDRVPRVAYMDGIRMVYEPDGKIVKDAEPQRRALESEKQEMERKYGEAYHTWWSPETRLKVMDQHGWDVQVCLPTANNGNFAYRVALKDVEVGAAMCRAYNNWCYEYCGADSRRLKFVAVLPGGDPAEMVKEARRAVEKLGAVSVRNPVLPDGKWLHDPENDPLWELGGELDFPISIHGEYRHLRFQPFEYNKDAQFEGNQRLSRQRLSLRGLDHALGFPFDNMTTLGYFIFTGILDRFPKLRLGLLESHCGWLPFWLGRLDDHTHGRNSVMGNAVDRLPLRPTEYFMRQCSIACDSDERALKSVVEYLNGDRLVWNSDYPHPDAPDPAEALPELDAQPISEEAKRKILWDNAVKLYGQRIVSAQA